MHTLKSCSAVLVLVALFPLLHLQAADNPSQAKLRELLRQSMSNPATPAAVEPAPVTPPAEPPPAPAKQVQPVPAPTPVKAAPVAAANHGFAPIPEPSSSANLVDVLRSETASAPAVVVTEPIPGVELKMRQPTATPAASAPTVSAPVEEGFKAVEVPAAEVAAPAAAPAEVGYKPIETPPAAVSTSKEQRLASLLQKYKADVVSPEEYHRQRAAILAEP